MCLTPITIKSKITGESHAVPCSKCPKCMARRVSSWSFRLLQEENQSTSALFLTLTYDTKHVPITENGFMSLSKRDPQLFMKRLRKVHSQPLKYYLCGEYGGKTNRPHYHIILFNARIDLIQAAWQLGSIHYGKVSGASVGYTLKYMTKGKKIPMHKNDDRQPEFALMSKKIGISYLSPSKIKWHHADLQNRMYVNIGGGKKATMPRYFKDKIYTEEQRNAVGFATRTRMEEEKRKFNVDAQTQVERDLASFRIMEKNSSLNRNKI